MDELIGFLDGKRAAILTGAGCSTQSGIPDYRGPTAKPRNPIQHRDFLQHDATRRRYWARSAIGWPRMAGAEPNAAHHAIAKLEAAGRLTGLVTQNVDRLHHAAGSRNVVELHGALAEVRCTECGALESRDALQRRIVALNPTFSPVGDFEASSATGAATAPDGDAELSPDLVESFRVPPCLACGGVLKPDVVFFGGSVPRERVLAAFAMLDAADALLVAGSSLAVFSGYRFALRASELRIPIAIVNRGPTRADPHAAVRVDGEVGAVLSALARALC